MKEFDITEIQLERLMTYWASDIALRESGAEVISDSSIHPDKPRLERGETVEARIMRESDNAEKQRLRPLQEAKKAKLFRMDYKNNDDIFHRYFDGTLGHFEWENGKIEISAEDGKPVRRINPEMAEGFLYDNVRFRKTQYTKDGPIIVHKHDHKGRKIPTPYFDKSRCETVWKVTERRAVAKRNGEELEPLVITESGFDSENPTPRVVEKIDEGEESSDWEPTTPYGGEFLTFALLKQVRDSVYG